MKCKTFITIWFALLFVVLILISQEASAQSGPQMQMTEKMRCYHAEPAKSTFLTVLDSAVKANYYRTDLANRFTPAEETPAEAKVKKTRKILNRDRAKHMIRRTSFSRFS